MKPEIEVFANCDDAFIVWSIEQRIEKCLGFALWRKRNEVEECVETWVGFEGDAAAPGDHKPSREWPIQKFMWSDYMAKSGDRVQYRVAPMVGTKGNLVEDEALTSDWSKEVIIRGGDAKISAYFNRGLCLSQWLSRRLDEEGAVNKAKKLKKIVADVNDKTRKFLAGELRLAILRLLKEAKDTGGKVYAMLYELNDPELIPTLIGLGKRANVILANGSAKKAGDDQNKEARTKLRGKVQLYNRMMPSGKLAHNKFMVLCDKNNKPKKAWSGSTNWSMTGLCTQVNNGILIEDAQIAAAYLDQWKLLKAAKNNFTDKLIEENTKRKAFKLPKHKATVWFTPVSEGEDLEEAAALINNAQRGIVFLMFNPGPSGSLLNTIIERNSPSSPYYDPKLYIHGVVNQDPSTKKTEVVGLFHRGEYVQTDYDVVLPEGIDERLNYWVAEISRGAFLRNVGWAMVHSKVILIDPCGDHPVVMTGSHNLGPKASSKNDDNLIIIENDKELAAAYAVNIMAVYNQCRWRYHLKQSATSREWKGLEAKDTWQDGYLKDAKRREIRFWMNRPKE
jgi:phosphatidylserine/phosphatidylglycerophosphate/cardiolipin synthase-like enzyme